jgi:hypothetical protein
MLFRFEREDRTEPSTARGQERLLVGAEIPENHGICDIEGTQRRVAQIPQDIAASPPP